MPVTGAAVPAVDNNYDLSTPFTKDAIGKSAAIEGLRSTLKPVMALLRSMLNIVRRVSPNVIEAILADVDDAGLVIFLFVPFAFVVHLLMSLLNESSKKQVQVTNRQYACELTECHVCSLVHLQPSAKSTTRSKPRMCKCAR